MHIEKAILFCSLKITRYHRWVMYSLFCTYIYTQRDTHMQFDKIIIYSQQISCNNWLIFNLINLLLKINITCIENHRWSTERKFANIRIYIPCLTCFFRILSVYYFLILHLCYVGIDNLNQKSEIINVFYC